MRTLALLLPLALLGCESSNNADFEQCELDLVLSPTAAAPGEVVQATGQPMSDALDTAIRVEGIDASVVEVVEPEACEACETCRSDAECSDCETCDTCESECADCAPSVSFEVPELPAGQVGIVVANRYGTSLPLPFEVLPSNEE